MSTRYFTKKGVEGFNMLIVIGFCEAKHFAKHCQWINEILFTKHKDVMGGLLNGLASCQMAALPLAKPRSRRHCPFL